MDSLAQALNRHPAFVPHRLLGAIGLASFWSRNAVITIVSAVALTLCVMVDHSFLISNGYGYLQHPGIFGWYLVQFVMPVSIYKTLCAVARSGKHFREIVQDGVQFDFRTKVYEPMIMFISIRTPGSRSIFGFLSLVGFAAFAWNTFQNFLPGELAPLDFWDSIHFPLGYLGSRVYKFYIDALLLPSIVHVFAGVVWANISAIRHLCKENKVRLAPFNVDKCGGFGFLAELILSPTISALLTSGLAFFGVIYTHRTFDISTITGILIQTAILIVFYVIPTFVLRSVIRQARNDALRAVHKRQESYYEEILSGKLQGNELREAHEYLRYFSDISGIIAKIPSWPHLAKVASTFGISISPALISSVVSVVNTLIKLYPTFHLSLP